MSSAWIEVNSSVSEELEDIRSFVRGLALIVLVQSGNGDLDVANGHTRAFGGILVAAARCSYA